MTMKPIPYLMTFSSEVDINWGGKTTTTNVINQHLNEQPEMRPIVPQDVFRPLASNHPWLVSLLLAF